MTSQLKVFTPTPLSPTDYAGIRRALEQDGVAVVTGILQEDEQRRFLDFFWEAMTKRNGSLRREDPSSWSEENTDWYGTCGAGQYKHYGMAQEQHCWLIRGNDVIRDVFEKGVFATAEDSQVPCCVSLDGCAALFRPVVSHLDMHVDLVPELPGSDWGSVQGAYNLYEVKAEESANGGLRATAGFVCVVGSHRQYEAMWSARKADKSFKWPTKHWHKLEEDSPLQQEGSLISSPANSLILWRSDLLHKNYGGDFSAEELGSDNDGPRLPRLTQFVSFSPKKYRSDQAKERKAQAVLDGCCNNHWAALSLRVPIVPFPAWSDASKKIKVVLPEFCETSEEEEENIKTEEVCEPQILKRKKEEVDCILSSDKKKRKKTSAIAKLPKSIQELL